MINDTYYTDAVLVKFDEDEAALLTTKLVESNKLVGEYYEVREGDTLEYIAGLFYKRAKKWYVIAIANGIMNPFNLTPGTVLRIPVEDEAK